MKRQYVIGATHIGAEDQHFQTSLRDAYQNAIPLACACTEHPPYPPLYIAKITASERFEVRRMPGQGAKHALDCAHYEPPPGVSGLGHVAQAIEEGEGRTTLKLDFALTKMKGRRPPIAQDDAVKADSAKSKGTKLTITSTLHYLWNRAGFNSWFPAMLGKRSYGVFYKYLMQAAQTVNAKGYALNELLYIPEPFRREDEQNIKARRRQKFAQLAVKNGTTTKLGLLVGELYEIKKTHFGHELLTKGALDSPFKLDADLHKRMVKNFELEMSLADSDDHLIVIATFSVDVAGTAHIQEMGMMVTNSNWLPIETTYEKEFIATLIDRGRSFNKGLRFNLPATTTIANAVLRDTQEPTACCVLAPGIAVDEASFESEFEGLKLWLWKVGEEAMPALPMAKVSP